MEEHDPLFAVMEFGVGLAGFAGVAFAVSRKGALSQADLFRLRNLLGSSLGAAFFALVPVLLNAMPLSSINTWRITSALLLVYHAFATAMMRSTSQSIPAEQREQMSRTLRGVVLANLALSVVLLAANTVGWPGAPQFWPVLFALIAMLLHAAINFVRLLTAPRRDAA